MLATPHILAGAATTRVIRIKPLGLVVALGLHQALDMVPHLDSHALFGAPGGLTRAEVASTAVDTVLGCILLFWLIRRLPNRGYLIAGGLMGILIDLVDNVPPWSQWFRAWSVGAWISAFHHGHQYNVRPEQWVLGFGTQLAVVIASAWILRKWGSRKVSSPSV